MKLALNILLSGEEEAQTLGLDVKQARLWILLWIAVLCADAVAVGGGGRMLVMAMLRLFQAKFEKKIFF